MSLSAHFTQQGDKFSQYCNIFSRRQSPWTHLFWHEIRQLHPQHKVVRYMVQIFQSRLLFLQQSQETLCNPFEDHREHQVHNEMLPKRLIFQHSERVLYYLKSRVAQFDTVLMPILSLLSCSLETLCPASEF